MLQELIILQIQLKNELISKDLRFFARIKARAMFGAHLLVGGFSKAIKQSKEHGDGLTIRGWNGAHREITYYSKSYNLTDGLFFCLIIIYSILIILGHFALIEFYKLPID